MIFDKVSIKPFRNRKDRCGGVAVLLGTAKPFPKEICEPARRKILDQAKFLSKGRFIGYWGKDPRSCININFNTFFRRNVADIDYDISLF